MDAPDMHGSCTSHAHEASGACTLPKGLHRVPAGHLAAVVTYLEMRAPPAARGEDRPTGAGIGPEEMAPDAFRALFAEVGTPWLWSGALERPEADLAAELRDPAVVTLVPRRDGRALGMMQLDFRRAGACEIVYLGLVPEAVGAGLGRALMAAGIARAFAGGPLRLHVHTCTLDAPGALDFYLRSGFVPVRQEVEVRLDPRGRTLPANAAPRIPAAR